MGLKLIIGEDALFSSKARSQCFSHPNVISLRSRNVSIVKVIRHGDSSSGRDVSHLKLSRRCIYLVLNLASAALCIESLL